MPTVGPNAHPSSVELPRSSAAGSVHTTPAHAPRPCTNYPVRTPGPGRIRHTAWPDCGTSSSCYLVEIVVHACRRPGIKHLSHVDSWGGRGTLEGRGPEALRQIRKTTTNGSC